VLNCKIEHKKRTGMAITGFFNWNSWESKLIKQEKNKPVPIGTYYSLFTSNRQDPTTL
jgi:hypothetical protein